MSIVKEFRDFAIRGNAIDLAVGIIIGAAFGKIVSALVNQMIMPPIGMLASGLDFSQMKIVLRAAGVDAAKKATPEVSIGYGFFINTLIEFVIVALAVFILVKAINTLKRKQEAEAAAPPPPTKQEQLLTEIRDLLKVR